MLEFNGDLYACDHFVFPQWRIGNIHQRPLTALIADPMVGRFARLKTDLPSACRDCQYLEFCNGGCPKHHMPLGTDPARVNHFCEGYKRFFALALDELKRMAEYFRNGQTPPRRGAVTARPAPQAPQPATRPPGRNDPCPCGSGRKFKSCCGRN